jgi:hypothetical protein
MRLPQVSERIKEAPAQALRGVFAGIGQLLLITDKLRNKTPAHPAPPQAQEAPQAAQPPQAAEPPQAAAAEPSPAPEASAAEAPGTQRDSGKTGNVRLLTEEAGGADVPAAEAGGAEVPAAETVVPAGAGGLAAEQVPTEPARPAAAEPARAAKAQAVAPLPNYDELTIASLRARLRNLSVDQVREMAEYERAHAARPEVITMLERRVAKLEAGG